MTKLEEKRGNRPTARRRGLRTLPASRRGSDHPFASRVFEAVRRIRRGETLTYKQTAARAGSPRAYRAVGSILKRNYDLGIPCHRVIRSDGKLGGYNRGGSKTKLKLLQEEKSR